MNDPDMPSNGHWLGFVSLVTCVVIILLIAKLIGLIG